MPSSLTFDSFFKGHQSSANSQVFFVDCFPLIRLKHLNRGMICVFVWVHISMTYSENETLKNSFRLGGQL